MAHAFPRMEEIKYNSIVASPDIPAQVLNFKSGVYSRFPAYYFGRSPGRAPFSSDLVIKSVKPSSKVLAALEEIDQTILGFTRLVDHK